MSGLEEGVPITQTPEPSADTSPRAGLCSSKDVIPSFSFAASPPKPGPQLQKQAALRALLCRSPAQWTGADLKSQSPGFVGGSPGDRDATQVTICVPAGGTKSISGTEGHL